MKTLIKKLLGEKRLGALEYYRSRADIGMGGPFNGQKFRQQIFLELINLIKFDAIIETGSFHGTTTEFMAVQSGLPVYTVEYRPRNFGFARARLRRFRTVYPHMGDSRDFLRMLSRTSALVGRRLFFYLDAHWNEDLPLREEIEIIFGAWSDATVMVDDFQVPDDPDYRYDDYGVGKALRVEYLRGVNHRLSAWFPAAPGIQESGAKRGCIVIGKDEAVVQVLNHAQTLKKGPEIL